MDSLQKIKSNKYSSKYCSDLNVNRKHLKRLFQHFSQNHFNQVANFGIPKFWFLRKFPTTFNLGENKKNKMTGNLPFYISLTFAFTTVVTLSLFIWTISNANSETIPRKSIAILTGLIIWLAIQTILSIRNIYNTGTNLFPPKILLLGVLPPLMTILILFVTQKGRQFIDSLSLKGLTYLNIVRIPVELVLFWLYLNKAIPELMTFEGRNFDIVAGITAPFIAYFGFTKNKLKRRTILIWNFISLGLLLNIIVNGILSAPTPLQKFAFDQPNVAILNFPFSWLPTFIVPIVLFAHLASIRQLIKQKVSK